MQYTKGQILVVIDTPVPYQEGVTLEYVKVLRDFDEWEERCRFMRAAQAGLDHDYIVFRYLKWAEKEGLPKVCEDEVREVHLGEDAFSCAQAAVYPPPLIDYAPCKKEFLDTVGEYNLLPYFLRDDPGTGSVHLCNATRTICVYTYATLHASVDDAVGQVLVLYRHLTSPDTPPLDK